MIHLNETIVLKPIEIGVEKDIFNTIDREREYLREWLPFVDLTKGEEDTLGFVKETIDTGQTVFTIHESNEFIGLIGFNNMDTVNQKAEIGYWISENKQGRGIITCAVKKLLEIAFRELSLNSIRIHASTSNTKSSNIPKKLGFSLEGIMRDGEMLVDNKFTDLAIYSILKKEFIV